MIYFASPYSDKDPSVVINRYDLTCKKVAELVANGIVVMSPIVYGHTLLNYKEMPGDWEFWKNFCEKFLYKCDEMFVYKLVGQRRALRPTRRLTKSNDIVKRAPDGWDKSTGVLAEIELAKSVNMKITYIE